MLQRKQRIQRATYNCIHLGKQPNALGDLININYHASFEVLSLLQFGSNTDYIGLFLWTYLSMLPEKLNILSLHVRVYDVCFSM